MAEQALGHALPLGAVVHHVDGQQGLDNPNALVICQDQAYHLLLHQRLRALRVCGHADWRKCSYCKNYSPIQALNVRLFAGAHHKHCASARRRVLRTPGMV